MAVGLPVVAGLLSALGAPVGAYIGMQAKEELKEGQQHLRVLAHILLALAVFFVVSHFSDQPWIAALSAFCVGGVLSYIDLHQPRLRVPSDAFMVLLGIALFTLLGSPDFVALASVTFMYGITLGTLYVAAHTWTRSLRYAGVLLGTFGVLVLLVRF